MWGLRGLPGPRGPSGRGGTRGVEVVKPLLPGLSLGDPHSLLVPRTLAWALGTPSPPHTLPILKQGCYSVNQPQSQWWGQQEGPLQGARPPQLPVAVGTEARTP